MSTKNGMEIILQHKTLLSSPEDIGVREVLPITSTYHIYLSVDKESMFTEEENQTRRYAATVNATDLEDAFKKAQADLNPEYALKKIRSCSVGDLIQDDQGFYMICTSGFKLICLLDTGND